MYFTSLPKWLPFAHTKRKNKAITLMKNFVAKMVSKRITQPDANDLLQVLINTHSGDFQEICNDAMSLLIAGHETSGAALSWTLALLCKHPVYLEICEREAVTISDTEKNHPTSMRLYTNLYAFSHLVILYFYGKLLVILIFRNLSK